MSTRVCIIEGLRTPFAKAGGPLNHVHAYQLGRMVVSEMLARCDRPDLEIDQVVFGNIIGPPEASNIARVVALQSGLPAKTPAYTVNMNCASALLSVAQGYDQILSGQARSVLVGGTESMSNAPLHFPKTMSNFLANWMRARSFGAKLAVLKKFSLSYLKPVITLTQGLTDPISGLIMGDTAELLADRYSIGREEQDRFALRSHQRYFTAKARGFYNTHVIPIYAPEGIPKGTIKALDHDVGPRDNLTIAQLAKLKPYFDRRNGTVTVGNACPITDGAACCLLMEEHYARSLGFEPKFFIRSYGFLGLPPEIMGLGPAVATPVALRNAGVSMSDIELVEINEAFAVQILANQRVFESPKLYKELTGESSILSTIDDGILNVNGGAIAFGHPVGTSGTRILLNLMYGLEEADLNLGLASICVGGGLGGSMIVERA